MFLPFLHRLFASLLTLAGVLVVTFFLLHVVPGGPFDQERKLPPEIEKNMYERYGLHKRGSESFLAWVTEDFSTYATYLKRGKLGPSLKYRDRDVGEIIGKAFLPSLELGAYAMALALVGGLFLGLLSAFKPHTWLDRALEFAASLHLALPGFVLAILLVLIFSQTLSLFPPALWEGGAFKILPTFSLAAVPLFTFSRMIRHEILQEMKKDYIRTAMAKGLPLSLVVAKHALKNALTPFLSLLGPTASHLITGSFIVETIFSIPGLGKHFITSVIDRDYFLVMGVVCVYAVILIALNWAVDMGYRVVNPRLR